MERPAEVELACVAVQHCGLARTRTHAREPLDPLERVERVAAQERRRLAHRTADPLVLVAPVLLALGLARKVEVEMPRPPGRARRTAQYHPQHVRIDVVVDQLAEAEQLSR